MTTPRLTIERTHRSFISIIIATALIAVTGTALTIPAAGEGGRPRLTSFDINVDTVVDNDLTKVKFIFGFTNPRGNLRGGELKVEVKDAHGITQTVRAELSRKAFGKQAGKSRVSAKIVCSDSPWLEMKAWLVDSKGKKSNYRSLQVESIPNPRDDHTVKIDWPLGTEAYRRIMNFYAWDQDGKRVQLYDYYGKIIFIEFTGMYCTPGKWMLEEVNQLYKKWGKNKNVVFLTVFHEGFKLGDIPTVEDAKDWCGLLKQKFPALIDPEAQAWHLYRNPERPDAVPQYMMVNPWGIIHSKGVGWGPNFFYDTVNETIKYMVNRWFPE